jgi:hypothetical protein
MFGESRDRIAVIFVVSGLMVFVMSELGLFVKIKKAFGTSEGSRVVSSEKVDISLSVVEQNSSDRVTALQTIRQNLKEIDSKFGVEVNEIESLRKKVKELSTEISRYKAATDNKIRSLGGENDSAVPAALANLIGSREEAGISFYSYRNSSGQRFLRLQGEVYQNSGIFMSSRGRRSVTRLIKAAGDSGIRSINIVASAADKGPDREMALGRIEVMTRFIHSLNSDVGLSVLSSFEQQSDLDGGFVELWVPLVEVSAAPTLIQSEGGAR